jgi:hypothetical protein
MRRLALAVAVLAVCALPASASASTTFGANLNRVPNNTSTCGSFDNGFYDPATFNSCSWDFNDLATGESVFPPIGQGVISRVRVRVGPTTGPMQVVVEQALRQDIAPDPASGYYVDQHLALSVLARNVPIPASTDSNSYLTGWFPAWRNGDERAGGYGLNGYVILFNADWDPAGAGGGAGGGGNVPGINFGRVRTLRDGTARLPITLAGPGLLRITDDQATAAAKRRPKARVQTIRRNIAKKGTVTVRIRPSKSGKRTLRRKHKLKVKLRVTFTPSGAQSSAVTTKSVTLKLKRKRRR